MNKSNKTLKTGITQMTAEKHKFEGFVVRRSKHSHSFWRYVSACQRSAGRAPLNTRRKRALAQSTLVLDALDEVLKCKRSWKVEDNKEVLTKKSALAISQLGFKIKFPAT